MVVQSMSRIRECVPHAHPRLRGCFFLFCSMDKLSQCTSRSASATTLKRTARSATLNQHLPSNWRCRASRTTRFDACQTRVSRYNGEALWEEQDGGTRCLGHSACVWVADNYIALLCARIFRSTSTMRLLTPFSRQSRLPRQAVHPQPQCQRDLWSRY